MLPCVPYVVRPTARLRVVIGAHPRTPARAAAARAQATGSGCARKCRPTLTSNALRQDERRSSRRLVAPARLVDVQTVPPRRYDRLAARFVHKVGQAAPLAAGVIKVCWL